jgi:hypothetical protein
MLTDDAPRQIARQFIDDPNRSFSVHQLVSLDSTRRSHS